MRRTVLFLAVLVGLFAGEGVAAEPSARPPQPLAPRSSTAPLPAADGKTEPARKARTAGANGWTTAGMLGLVLLVFLGGAAVLRRGMPRARSALPSSVLSVLGHRPVDPQNSVYLVRCGSRLLLLGASRAGLTTLAQIDDAGEVESLTRLCAAPEGTAAAGSVGGLLAAFRQPGGQAREEESSAGVEEARFEAERALRARLFPEREAG